MKRVILLAVLMWCVACAPTEEIQEGVARVQESPTATPIAVPTTDPYFSAIDILIEGRANGETEDEVLSQLHEADVDRFGWTELDDEWIVALAIDRQYRITLRENEVGPGHINGITVIVSDAGLRFRDEKIMSFNQVVNFDEDQRLEYVLSYFECGAHTCSSNYKFVQKHPNGKYELLSREMGRANSGKLILTTFEGQKAFALHGGRVSSVGAGNYQRESTTYWTYNTETNDFERAGVVYDESPYRFHALEDANQLFRNGEYDSAKPLYEEIVLDTTKYEDPTEWNPNSGEGESTYDDTVRLSAFRLVLVNLILGDEVQAEKWGQWLSETYGGSMAADALPLLTQSDDDLAIRCQAVTDYLQQQEEVGEENAVGALYHVKFSYAHQFSYGSFCPVHHLAE